MSDDSNKWQVTAIMPSLSCTRYTIFFFYKGGYYEANALCVHVSLNSILCVSHDQVCFYLLRLVI